MTARARPVFHVLRVAAVRPAADDAVALVLAVPPPLRAAFRYRPGQHVTLRHRPPGGGAELRRTYSLCGPAAGPDGPAALTLGVRRVPGGAFSDRALAGLAPGDPLQVLPPAGRFTLDPRPGRFAAVTGGSGITPVLAMAATLLAREPAASFTLLRSERTAGSAMFLEEVAALKDRHPARFAAPLALTREDRAAGPAGGRLDAARLRRLLPALVPPAGVDGWYLCGPAGLVAAARAALRELGVPDGRVRTEVFHAAPPPVPATPPDGSGAGGGRLTVTLDGRRTTWPLAPGEPLLSAVLRHRPDAPHGCRGGVCGTCRARLVRGAVRSAPDDALEPAERAAGYVLTCRTRPDGEQPADVEVDFDA